MHQMHCSYLSVSDLQRTLLHRSFAATIEDALSTYIVKEVAKGVDLDDQGMDSAMDAGRPGNWQDTAAQQKVLANAEGVQQLTLAVFGS